MSALLLVALAVAAPLEGRVRERGSGEPVAGATVRLADGTTVQTDGKGRFTVEVPDGQVALTVEDERHPPKTVTLTVPRERDLVVYLAAPDAPFEIVVESFQPTAHATRRRVDAEQALETPGTHDDAVRLVQALPGVAVQREYGRTSGELSVRGSLPGENRVLLDGVEVPYLYHFNDYASVFPTSQLGRLDLLPSTFGASWGDAIGAVVDARTLEERPTAAHGSVTFNSIQVGGELRAPIGKRWWVAAAGRRSYHDLGNTGTPQYPKWPRFHDWMVRAWHGSARTGTGVFAYGAGDSYQRAAGELDALDPIERAEGSVFTFRRDFAVVGLTQHFSGEHLDGRTVIATVLDTTNAELSAGGSEHRSNGQVTARADLQGRDLLIPGATSGSWSFGADLRADQLRLEVADAGEEGILVAREAAALARGVSGADTVLRLRGGLYGELVWTRGPIRMVPGARLDVDSLSERVTGDPRLSVQWQLAKQTALKIAAGRYHQFASSELLAPTLGDPTLGPATSWQVGGGIEQTVAHRWEIELSGYSKWNRDTWFQSPQGELVVAEAGQAWGIEVVTRYRLRERFFLWGWASLGRARVRLDEGWVSSDSDQPWAAGVVASWNPLRHFNLAVRYRAAAGLPYTPIQGGAYDATDDQWLPLFGVTNGKRMPFYQKVDAQVAYTFELRRARITLRAEAWYVPKDNNVLYPAWSYDWSEEQYVRGISFIPLLGMRVEF